MIFPRFGTDWQRRPVDSGFSPLQYVVKPFQRGGQLGTCVFLPGQRWGGRAPWGRAGGGSVNGSEPRDHKVAPGEPGTGWTVTWELPLGLAGDIRGMD